jgi:flagellar hook-associated protein 1 FlgK
MPLSSALQIGRSALSASQVAIAITGNNFANAATPGYSRQIVGLVPTRDTRYGNAFIGRGVEISGINRQVDSALQSRLWDGISRQASAGVDRQLLSQVEATLNELSETDLSSELSAFFNVWSDLSSAPGSSAERSLVVQQGRTLAGFMQRTREDLSEMRLQIDRQLEASIARADELLSDIASLNASIVTAEAGSAVANALRDQRDALVTELSEMLGVTVVEQPSGAIDVLAGSIPLVLNGSSRGLELRRETNGSTVEVSVGIRNPREEIEVPPATGRIGALLAQREELVNDTLERLDEVASQLIFQVNRLHSQGYSSTPLTSVRGTRTVPPGDTTLALNDPANRTFADLPFRASNGGFLVTVRNTETGSMDTVRIDVDLDGIDNAGAAGFGDDTSVADIAAALDGIANLSATMNADGTISIDAAAGYDVSFAEDSSGALAVLGINTYFTGQDASDIGVRQELLDEPGRLNTGWTIGGQPTDNGVALAIAQLADQGIAALGGASIQGAWQDAVVSIGLRTDAALTRAEATTLVRESLEAQRAAVSGVSIDEESINLLTYQRQYQGAARFIAAVDEMTQTLIQLI